MTAGTEAVGLAIAMVALSAAAAGCVHRELVSFEDHETKALTAMRVRIDTSYYFWRTHEHVFYSCAEQGDRLVCKRLCGGTTDLVCPEETESGRRAETNIQ